MYQVFCDERIIYDLRDEECILINPKLSLETNNAGSFEFRMPLNHPFYGSIQNLISCIKVERNGVELFRGRPIKSKEDYRKRLWVYCEGDLAILRDTIQRPAEYHNMSVRNYLGTLISLHNSQVEASKRFTLGAVSVTDPNDSLYRYSNYESTLGCINEKLIKRLGGYLRIRYVNGTRYLDYLKDPWNTNTQIIDFDQNLLDFVKDTDASEIATAIIPLGVRLEESRFTAIDERLTIKQVNGGLDYVYNQAAVNAFGFIFKTVTWDDVTTPAALLANGKAYLNEVQFENLCIEASAVDLHDLDVEIEMLNVNDLVKVRSAPHGLDRFFPISKMVIQLDSPSSNVVTLGNNEKNSLTSASSNANASILGMIENQPSKSSILESAKQNASDLIITATTGFVTVRSNEILITDTVDFMKATYVWRWNRNGLGYSSTGYNGSYGLAMTIDGHIVADFIDTGVLTASLIKAGILSDAAGKNKINMLTGEADFTGSFTTRFSNGRYSKVNGSGLWVENEQGTARRGIYTNATSNVVANVDGLLVARPNSDSSVWGEIMAYLTISNNGMPFFGMKDDPSGEPVISLGIRTDRKPYFSGNVIFSSGVRSNNFYDESNNLMLWKNNQTGVRGINVDAMSLGGGAAYKVEWVLDPNINRYVLCSI